MVFRILESHKNKLGDQLESENFETTLEQIAKAYKLSSEELKVFCENRNGIFTYKVFHRQTKIAVFEPF